MQGKPRPQVIAIEEHYWDPTISATFGRLDPMRAAPGNVERLHDLGALRLKEMDEAGVDIQVLSHGAPATQRLDAESAVKLAHAANDHLYETVQERPDRFAAFATIPTPDPKAAADELERTVTRLGFKGAMVHGPTNGVFFDDKRFWPIFERAQALDVPLYIHPAEPDPRVVEVYYKEYIEKFPGFLTAGWGFTVECATQVIRLILSGVFDTYPRLKIVVGHLGEGIPFYLWRIDQALSRRGNDAVSFREYFSEHFYITTSGFFSTPALTCCIMELGVDRILFSIDYPFVANAPGTKWITDLQLNAEDKIKILNGNAKRLLKM
jgi:predicted TIM-barrel fold metal-dependent hydrolase